MDWGRILSIQLLNPVVRPLCQAVKDYSNIRNDEQQEQLRRKMECLQLQAELLQHLEQRLLKLPHILPPQHHPLTNDELKGLADFISLPLKAILRSYQPFATHSQQHSSSSAAAVLQSAVWKTVERASAALRAFVKNWWMKEKIFASLEATDTTSRLQTYLSVLVTALPSGPTIKTTYHHRSSNKASLDTGEACIISMFLTLQALAGLDGIVTETFLIPILDASIALIEPPPPPARNSSPKDSIPDTLQQGAVDVIRAVLQKTAVPCEEWRRFFPAVYTGLFRRILFSLPLLSSRKQQHGVVTTSIQALAELSRICLRLSDATTISTEQQPLDLKAMFDPKRIHDADQSTNASTSDFLSSLPTEEREFFEQVLQRIPLSMPRLVIQLQGSRTATVRRATLALVQAYLSTHHRIWERNTEVPKTMFEALLVLCNDDDEDTAKQALSLSTLYSTKLVTPSDVKEWITPRIMELLERLTTLAHRGEEAELTFTLQRLRGYLKVLVDPQHRRDFRHSFCSEESTKTLRKVLGTLLDVDFEARTSSWVLLAVGDGGSTSRRRLRYVQTGTAARLVYEVVRSFGAVLGAKRTALLIDSCIADMYKSAMDRSDRKVSLEGHSQIQWLHEWIGTFTIVSELSRGAFQDSNKRLLAKLTRSILPLLTSGPFWTFPTQRAKPKILVSQGNAFLLEEDKESVEDHAYRGNCAFRGDSLACIQTIVKILGPDANPIAVTLLYPVLEQANVHGGVEVEEAALSLLSTFAIDCCNLDSVSALIAVNAESSLIPAIWSKLHSSGVASKNQISADRLLLLLESTRTILEIGLKESETNHIASVLPGIQGVVLDLVARFDFAPTKDEHEGRIALHLLKLFGVTIQHMQKARELSVSEPVIRSDDDLDPWTQSLNEFRVDQSWKNHVESQDDCGEQVTNENHTESMLLRSLKSDADFISKISWRCCYLLSHPSLKVEIQSCETLSKSFKFLGFLITAKEAKSSESNGPQTSVLRQISATWPTISSHFRNMCSALSSSGKTSLVIVTGPSGQTKSLGERKVLLTKTIELISEMTMVSEDFMVSRLREVVIPNLRSLLSHFRTTATTTKRGENRSQIDLALLSGTIQCLGSIYCNQMAGVGLADQIPKVGAALLSFLEDSSEFVVTKTKEALKHLLALDGDSLFFQLLEVSKAELCQQSWQELVPIPSPQKNMGSRSSKAAEELLFWFNSLPETNLR